MFIIRYHIIRTYCKPNVEFKKYINNISKKLIFASKKIQIPYVIIINHELFGENTNTVCNSSLYTKLKKNINVVIFNHDNYTIEETIILFGNTNFVIGVYGSGLENCIYCKEGAHILELIPESVLHTSEKYIYYICMQLSLDYYIYVLKERSSLKCLGSQVEENIARFINNPFDKLANTYVKQKNSDSFKRRVDSIVKEIMPNTNILELGCGIGNYLNEIYKNINITSVTGVDNSISMINYGKKTYPYIHFVYMHIFEFLENTLSKYDTILLIGVIEYIIDIERFFQSIYGIIKPGGKIIIINHRPGTSTEKYLDNYQKKHGELENGGYKGEYISVGELKNIGNDNGFLLKKSYLIACSDNINELDGYFLLFIHM